MRRVFAIAAHGRFADLLAQGILSRHGDDPLSLARVTVLLPTRRACRTLREAFLRARGGRPSVLPRLLPLGEVEEESLAFLPDAGAELALPPAASPLARRCLLTRIIAAVADPATGETPTPGQALGLAEALAALLDQVQAEELSFDRLEEIGLDLPEHWRRVAAVLNTITHAWPQVLAETGRIDPMARRVALMRRQTEAWTAHPPADPVIAAGSTGSHPATARLLAAVAGLPAGAVVLPGLDRDLDAASWAALEPSHPQYGLKHLLAVIGCDRAEVADWLPQPPPPPRVALLRETFRPAATAGAWTEMRLPAAAAEGVFRLDCANPREEATAIALIFRETLETPGRTAALVTPDRDLAQRVAEQMRRWGVEIDDSAGVPLGQSPVGRFLRLVLEATADGFSPVALLAVLRHPLCALGRGLGADAVADFDRFLARGPKPAPGWDDYRRRLDALDEENRLAAPRLLVLSGLIELFAAAAAPFAEILSRVAADLPTLLAAHVACAEALAGNVEVEGWEALWRGEDGAAAHDFFAEALSAADLGQIAPAAYGEAFDALTAGVAVRPRFGGHPRLHVLGPLEARLQPADVMILGGMNEGAWPRDPAPDPWMSRGMRAAFGLPPTERRVGLAAHDVLMAAAAPTLIFTRAEKAGGAPTEPSRWLRRLDAVLAAGGATLPRGPWLAWARALDAAPAVATPPRPPAPKPPVEARPRRVAATKVEMLMRDAYAFYARSVLGLYPLDPREQEVSPADLGNLMHKVLETLVAEGGSSKDPDALERLTVLADAALAEHDVPPELAPFWRARIGRALAWFVATDAPRAAAVQAVEAEGEWTLTPSSGRDFVLTAKADRIDLDADGGVTVIDYKTGALPSATAVAGGKSPQLPLEGAIVRAGGFPGLKSRSVAALEYWRIHGLGEGGERRVLKDAAALIDAAEAGLRALVDRYDDPATPYPPRAETGRAAFYADYLVLERLAEWAAAGEDEG
jgi:ATP-dependent helicase/nuclease subunit B